MASNSYLTNIPKLKGRENYREWAFAVENLLILEGTANCIKQENVTEPAAVAEDAKAKAKIILTIDPSLYVHIREATTTRNLWTRLQNMFDDSGFSRRISLLRSLISIRLEGSESITNYVTQIIETAQKLSGTGFAVNDEWIGCLMLAGLPEKYFPMIMAIEHSGIAITADVIKTKLIDMAGNDEAGSAFLSRGQHSRQRNYKVDSSGKNDSKNKSHHGSGLSMNSENVNKSKMNVKCYRCKQFGHYKNQCNQSNNQQTEKLKQTHAFSVVFMSGNYGKHDWYLDSGASAHMTRNENMMQNTSFTPSIKEIIAANQSAMPVLCTGDVDIITITPNCKYEVTLKEVLCVPNLTTNLISISQLIKNGNRVEFTEKSCNVYNRNSELVAVADLIDGVYKLAMQYKQCLFTSSAISSEVWHRRMGHINMNDLNIMKEGAVTGISYTDKSVINKSTCTVCCEGKQSRLPFGNAGTRSNNLLHIIHADVCGPMESTSIGGARYFLILIDDYSRMAFVYFLKAKSEVFKYFIEFKAMVENQQSSKIRIFRTDNGLEFCSNEFENYLKEVGIIHQKTNAYTPEQNGLSERINRTIVERARCLLFDAKLDKKFWAEATNTAVYLRNRSVASGLNNKTPFELWTNRKPDLSHIRIFGSEVMVHIPKEKRLKWDSKSKKQILVGFSENVKGYRVYDPIKRSVTTSRDVIVHENTEKKCSDDRVSVSVGDICQEKESDNVDVKSEPDHSNLNISVESQYDDTLSELDSTLQQPADTESTKDEANTEVVTKRVRRQPERYGFTNLCTLSEPESISDPVTIHEALNSPDKEKWIEAMQDELQAFDENQAWVPVDKLPSDKTLVKCKWIFKRKVNSDKSVKYRARLVAKGFTQKAGIDYEDTFSPVVRHSTLRLLFALSVQLNFDITHLDVKTAFLNGYLKEDIYMTQPDISCDVNKSKVIVKLNKAIYGLKQSSRSWYERVEQCLCELGFKKCKLEPCVFTKINNDVKIVIALYVDDFFVYSNSKEETDKLVSVLSSNFKIKNLGQVQQCLGMRIKIDKKSNVITLDQEEYIDQLLHKFNMINCKSATTPMECKLNINKSETCDQQIPYQQLIGSIMYF